MGVIFVLVASIFVLPFLAAAHPTVFTVLVGCVACAPFVLLGYWNRRYLTAWRNGYEVRQTLRITVRAREKVYHVTEMYDERLVDVTRDCVTLIEEAPNVVPLATNVSQTHPCDGGFLRKDRKEATIEIVIAADTERANLESLQENLETALSQDKRITRLKGIESEHVSGPIPDGREALESEMQSDTYRELGRDVDEAPSRVDRLVEEAEQDVQQRRN